MSIHFFESEKYIYYLACKNTLILPVYGNVIINVFNIGTYL